MREMKFYGQHGFEDIGITPFETCGISCLLMAKDYFGVDFPTTGKEKSLYLKYHSKAAKKGMLGSAIAYVLSEKKLGAKLVHSSEKLLENRENYYPQEQFEEILAEHKKYIKMANGAFSAEIDPDITGETLAAELKKDRLLIVQTFIEGNADGIHDKVMHWILLYGFENGIFKACDPLSGKTTFTQEELAGYMETPFGKTYISVWEK
ncbi:MAG: hypothetical protein IJ306_02815 [Oscillospiraceae bacterium]|nr:hypothetical protein [Oscillospiraceae bacterium]